MRGRPLPAPLSKTCHVASSWSSVFPLSTDVAGMSISVVVFRLPLGSKKRLVALHSRFNRLSTVSSVKFLRAKFWWPRSVGCPRINYAVFVSASNFRIRPVCLGDWTEVGLFWVLDTIKTQQNSLDLLWCKIFWIFCLVIRSTPLDSTNKVPLVCDIFVI